MYFDSLEFMAFIITYLLLLVCFPKKASKHLTLFASYLFYSYWNYKLLSLILVSTLNDFYFAQKIHDSNSQNQRKTFLVISIFINFGILFLFKYFNFFMKSFSDIFGITEFSTLQFILPIGISFYTLQTASYTIDVYKNEIKPERNLLNFALWVSFFPQLVAGPIERAKNLIPQLKNNIEFKIENLPPAMDLFLFGLFRKVVIADTLHIYVDQVYSRHSSHTGLTLFIASIFFVIQIFCDFSGYSLMARGIAKLININLSINFQQPLLTTSIRDFWREWHISLSFWLRDYLYFPLIKKHKSLVWTLVCYLIVFSISGLWHGANFTFISFGLVNGAGLCVEKLMSHKIKTLTPKVFKWILTQLVFTISLIYFRSSDLDQAHEIFFLIISDSFSSFYIPGHFVSCILVISFFIKDHSIFSKYKLNAAIRQAIILMMIVLFGIEDGAEYIYFQF